MEAAKAEKERLREQSAIAKDEASERRAPFVGF